MRLTCLNRHSTWRWLVVTVALVAGLVTSPPTAPAQQVLPCDTGGSGGYSQVSRPPQYGFLPQTVVSIPSQLDGADIQVGIVRPDVPAGVQVPVIVRASPYYHPLQHIDLRACAARLTENFVPQGYAVALVAVRGTADSGGCMNLFGPKERADLDQAITWLGERPWSSGAVGMTGLSYDGSTPWEVAAFGNPHLKTIVPVSGVTDIFQLLFGGGVAGSRAPLILNDVYYAESVVLYLPGRSVQSTVEVTACPQYGDGSLASVYSSLTGEHDPFGYWARRRYRDDVERNYRGSIFLVQGLQDWNVNPAQQFPWVNQLVEQAGDRPGPPGPTRRGHDDIHVKYLLGQWGHSNPDTASGAARRNDYADILLDWFDRWLKGRRGVDLVPTVEVQDSQGQWRTATAWPPEGVDVTWSLTPAGDLASTPADARASQLIAADPFHTQPGLVQVEPPEPLRALCEPPTCRSFSTAVFERPFRFAGLPRLRLTVTPQGPAGQISAYLYAVGPDGSQRLGWGQVDLRFPEGPEGASGGGPSAQPVTPGEPILADFDLQPLDAVVPAGARLVLVLSQGSAYNRLPGRNFPVELQVGGQQSTLTVNRVDPGPRAFFDPPS